MCWCAVKKLLTHSLTVSSYQQLFAMSYWCHITTHLVRLLVRRHLEKKSKAPSLQIRSGLNLARLFLKSICFNFVGVGFLIWRHTFNMATMMSFHKKLKTPSFQMRSGLNLAGTFREWIRVDWQTQISDITSYFQERSLYVISWKTSSPSCVMTLALCIRYSTWGPINISWDFSSDSLS